MDIPTIVALIGSAAALIGGGIAFGVQRQRINNLTEDVKELKRSKGRIHDCMNRLESEVKAGFSEIKGDFRELVGELRGSGIINGKKED